MLKILLGLFTWKGRVSVDRYELNKFIILLPFWLTFPIFTILFLLLAAEPQPATTPYYLRKEGTLEEIKIFLWPLMPKRLLAAVNSVSIWIYLGVFLFFLLVVGTLQLFNSIKRIHDLDLSVKEALFGKYNGAILQKFRKDRGTVGPNRFGDDPLEAAK